jgi:DNA-binding GntR family transcriptional regulator
LFCVVPKPSTRKNANESPETEKVPILVVERMREAILDEVFRPGDHLAEVDLAEKFTSAGRLSARRSSPWKRKARPL